MKEYNVKEMVMGKKVTLSHYQKMNLWYVTECGFEFPVPIEDTGDARFETEDKATFFMRWINAHIKSIKDGYAGISGFKETDANH